MQVERRDRAIYFDMDDKETAQFYAAMKQENGKRLIPITKNDFARLLMREAMESRT